jgi:hypothetical protein
MLSQPQLPMWIIRSDQIAQIEPKAHDRHANAVFDCSARSGSLRADRACQPPTSSSLGDEKHVPSLLFTLRAPRAEAGAR